MGPADEAAVQASVAASPLHGKYAESLDRESAREILAAKVEAGAARAEREQQDSAPDDHVAYPGRRRPRRSAPAPGGGTVSDVLASPLAKQLMRTATREIVRGVFGVGRRR
jgi:hypothetical protein